MKLCISNIAWNSGEDEAVYNVMQQYGFTGLEIAPTRIIELNPYESIDEAKRIAALIEIEYGFCISSMQSILFGRHEKLFGGIEDRNTLIDYLKKAINFANAIGCRNLVFGSPQNRVINKESDYYIAIDFFKEIGEYALSKKTVLSIEANPPIYNTNFINYTFEAFKLVKEVNSQGFKVNLDFGTIIQNNEDVNQLSNEMSLVNHVHISEPYLAMIQERFEHKKLAEILKSVGYSGYISIEMKRNETENIYAIEKALSYISQIFGGC